MIASTESISPTTSDAVPVSSEAKKPTENTAPNSGHDHDPARRTRMRPSISAAPTRDHQPASAYWPEDGTAGLDAHDPPTAPGGGGLE